MSPPPPPPAPCANCGAEVPERYCSRCGQRRDLTLHVSLGHLVVEALTEVFSVEGRMARTAIPFFLHPGFLAAEFLAGRRVRYSSPLRLYVLTSVLLFLVTALAGLPGEQRLEPGERASPELEARVESLITELPATYGPLGALAAAHLASIRSLPAGEVQYRIQQSWFAQAPRVAVFLLPVLALLLWLVHLGAGFSFAEHLVVAAHAQALAFAAVLPSAALHSHAGFQAGLLFAAGHLLLGMRRVYRRPWPATALRFTVVAAGYALAVVGAMGLARVLAFVMA